MDPRFSVRIYENEDGGKYSPIMEIGDRDGGNIKGQDGEWESIFRIFHVPLTFLNRNTPIFKCVGVI